MEGSIHTPGGAVSYPPMYAGVLGLALRVSLLPAMRAARVNPTQVLREE